MNKNWELKTLGEVCDFYNGLWTGKNPPYIKVHVIRNTNFTKDGLLSYLDIAQLEVESKQYLTRKLQYGDIILEKSGGGPKQPVGRVVVFNKNDGEYSFSNFTSVIRVKNSKVLYFEFLHKILFYYYVSGVTEKMQKNTTGIRNLDFSEYKVLEVPIPPLAEQKQIVKILNEKFGAIEELRKVTEQQIVDARELLESRSGELFNISGNSCSVDEVSNLFDSLHKTPKYVTEGFPMVRVTDVRPGYLNLEKTKKVTKETFEEFSRKHKPAIGDIVFSRVGSYGVSAIVNTDEKFCLGQNTVIIEPKIDSKFLYYFINSKIAKDQIDHLVAGTTQPTISLKSIKAIILPVYDGVKQKQIVKELDELSAKTKELELIFRKKITDLEEIKKSYLEQAFSGNL